MFDFEFKIGLKLILGRKTPYIKSSAYHEIPYLCIIY